MYCFITQLFISFATVSYQYLHKQIFGFWFWKVNVCSRVLVWRLLHAAHCTVIVLKNFDKLLSLIKREQLIGKVPLEATKKVAMFQNVKVTCEKKYRFQHFGNFLTDPRSPAIKFFRTVLTYLTSTPCEAIFSQSS